MPEQMPDPTSAAQPARDPLNARVASSIDNWKRKLLDLSRRNRLLNFRVNKVSTITVVDELPAEVFRTLYLREKGMRFLAAPDSEENGVSKPTESNPRLSHSISATAIG